MNINHIQVGQQSHINTGQQTNRPTCRKWYDVNRYDDNSLVINVKRKEKEEKSEKKKRVKLRGPVSSQCILEWGGARVAGDISTLDTLGPS